MKNFLIIFLAVFFAVSGFAADVKKLEKELNTVLSNNLKCSQNENIPGILTTVHTESPVYDNTRRLFIRICKNYDLKYELLSSKLAGATGEYAILRVKIKTTKIKGPAFKPNISDCLQIFKKENEKWKLWNACILSIKYL